MQHILPVDGRDALKQFINKFRKKFEQKEVPLSLALDPEMGIGYDELEQAGEGDDFIAQFYGKQSKKAGDLSEQLKKNFNKLIDPVSFASNEVIRLDKLGIQLAGTPATIPNSFSMLMSVADGLIFADQTGGTTANALSGRFTMASDKVLSHCQNISSLEQSANPDILFFDVAYMVETNVDNINRRKLVYNHQLSILNFDTSDDPLTLDDVMLSVQGNEVILRSKKYNKRIVPRMASAYNYSRSDLSVFRLLCDLQHQGIHPYLSISLEKLFPGKQYYPRIKYKNLILSPHKWLFNRTKFKGIEINKSGIQRVQHILSEHNVPTFFRAGNADQTLCFNSESPDDIIVTLDGEENEMMERAAEDA
ncbi:MAG: hypothetical protein EOO85_31370, partial [Pedobacter sp.]